MKRTFTFVVMAVLLLGVALPALGEVIPATVNPQQMGHPSYLEAAYGEEEATKILRSYGRPTTIRPLSVYKPYIQVSANGSTILPYFYGYPYGYYTVTTPTAVYTTPVPFYPGYVPPSAPTYPSIAYYTTAEATRQLQTLIDNKWDTSMFGSFQDSYRKTFGMTLTDDIARTASGGYITSSEFSALYSRVMRIINRDV